MNECLKVNHTIAGLCILWLISSSQSSSSACDWTKLTACQVYSPDKRSLVHTFANSTPLSNLLTQYGSYDRCIPTQGIRHLFWNKIYRNVKSFKVFEDILLDTVSDNCNFCTCCMSCNSLTISASAFLLLPIRPSMKTLSLVKPLLVHTS